MKKSNILFLSLFLYHLNFFFGLLIIGFFDIKTPLFLKEISIIYIFFLIIVLVFQKKSKNILSNCILFNFSLLFMLMLSNWILHYTVMEHLYYRPDDRFNVVSHEEPVTLHHYQPYVQYKGEAHGDLTAQSGHLQGKETKIVEFITDELGFRNQVQQKNKKNQMIVIGDSFAVGSGTTQDSTTVALIAQKTNKNIYNLSYPGTPFLELTQLAVYLPHIQRSTETDLLWFIFSGNDLEPCPPNYQAILKEIEAGTLASSFEQNGLQELQLWFANYYRKSPLRGLFIRTFGQTNSNNNPVLIKPLNDQEDIYFFRQYIDFIQQSKKSILQHPNYNCFKESIKSGKAFAKQQHLNLKLVYIPSKYEVYSSFATGKKKWSPPAYPTGFNLEVQDIAKDLELELLDATPFFITAAETLFEEEGKILWWRDDTHLNENGHRVLCNGILKMCQ